MYMDTNTDHCTPLALRVQGKKKCPPVKKRQPSVCGTATSATAGHEVPTHALTATDDKGAVDLKRPSYLKKIVIYFF